jgi:tetratricopeptide (TPR) repeat protein
MKMLGLRLFISGALLLSCATAALAVPPGFNEGVQAYGARRYSQALNCFSQAVRAEPNNPLIRYYMGLSYQGLNQMTLARQQYQWVAATRTDPALAARAAQALQNLSRYEPTRAGSQSAPPRSVNPSSGSQSAVAGAQQQLNGRLKIYYFTTDW